MCRGDVRWFWGTDVCLARTAQRRPSGSSGAWAPERKWANSKRKGRTNRVYICSLGTLPPTLFLSEVNLQLIRTWGYTGKEVKINPRRPQPLLHVHLLYSSSTGACTSWVLSTSSVFFAHASVFSVDGLFFRQRGELRDSAWVLSGNHPGRHKRSFTQLTNLSVITEQSNNSFGTLTKDREKSSSLYHCSCVCTGVVQAEQNRNGTFSMTMCYPHFPFQFDVSVNSKNLSLISSSLK